MDQYSTLILIALMVVAFYFLIMRPQRKRQQEIQRTLSALTPGQRVMLGSGLFGTIVTVTSLENGNRTTCRVGDRGPFIDGRVIDLSAERFAELAPLSKGVVRVRIEW